jgi:hypothetical protein
MIIEQRWTGDHLGKPEEIKKQAAAHDGERTILRMFNLWKSKTYCIYHQV